MVTPFNQPPPELGNTYHHDPVLRPWLERVFARELLESVEPSLARMGELAGEELYPLSLEDLPNEPVLTRWDAWGERIDHIELTRLWQRAEQIAAEEGVVATAYEAKHGALSRVHQFALVYLFGPSSDVYACPLAMTDGCARSLLDAKNDALADQILPHLLSRDPGEFWTSGQWMTESPGGSDVGLSETVARQDENGQWRLTGRKWFTSAATSQVALTLARPEGNPEGGRGLALFLVKARDEQGRLINIRLERLKDKLGTRKLPTAELWLDDTPAELVLGTTDGVKNITPMLNITRTWNTVIAAGGMRRAVTLARDYAKKRFAFGQNLEDKPLHIETLANMEAETAAAFHLSFEVVQLLGKKEAGEISPEEMKVWRLLTPIAKLTTGKQAVAVASEALEAIGGAGYVEDTGLPMLLRDAQTLPIWEGTTNVLSLDSLRAIGHTGGARELLTRIEACVGGASGDDALEDAGRAAVDAMMRALTWLAEAQAAGQDTLEAGARGFALTLGRSTALACMVRQAVYSSAHDDARPRAAAIRFARIGVNCLKPTDLEEARLLIG
ncbi:MAG: acyl-CoA dehydrogenase [Deltaproteobacteria bacterium]|nr:acyl-CoA dehydrogenase [Deltaproteobacteria bacterium]